MARGGLWTACVAGERGVLGGGGGGGRQGEARGVEPSGPARLGPDPRRQGGGLPGPGRPDRTRRDGPWGLGV